MLLLETRINKLFQTIGWLIVLVLILPFPIFIIFSLVVGIVPMFVNIYNLSRPLFVYYWFNFLIFVVTVLISISLAFGAYRTRRSKPKIYGGVEFVFGVISITVSTYLVIIGPPPVSTDAKERAAVAFVAGAYIMVRGLLCIDEGRDKRAGPITLKHFFAFIVKIARYVRLIFIRGQREVMRKERERRLLRPLWRGNKR
jgi:hypothetical protein